LVSEFLSIQPWQPGLWTIASMSKEKTDELSETIFPPEDIVEVTKVEDLMDSFMANESKKDKKRKKGKGMLRDNLY
jgi:hypothetical protein